MARRGATGEAIGSWQNRQSHRRYAMSVMVSPEPSLFK